ncbi:hypothetical protein [Endobacter medicaginis]|nr:hypothetical protein [Endobacter medicaginis]
MSGLPAPASLRRPAAGTMRKQDGEGKAFTVASSSSAYDAPVRD